MDSYQNLWARCSRAFMESVEKNVYDVWFSCIVFERYDEQSNKVFVAIPSRYVYEYLEQYQVPLLSKVLNTYFKPGVELVYRIVGTGGMQRQDVFSPAPKRTSVAVPNARERIMKGLEYFIGKGGVKWLPAYDTVAEWLADNKGRGLLCIGTNGLGKTLICERILPVLIAGNERRIPFVTAREMNSQIDSLLNERCVIVDDIGKEPASVTLNYRRRNPFQELCDAAERKGMLLILTTNLSTTPVSDARYPTSIEEYYGASVLSRLSATTKAVVFEGDDMRFCA